MYCSGKFDKCKWTFSTSTSITLKSALTPTPTTVKSKPKSDPKSNVQTKFKSKRKHKFKLTRESLTLSWSEAARRSGAAPVYVVGADGDKNEDGDVEAEFDVPPGLEGFEWLEREFT